MEKLLHERLRDYSHNNFTSVEISGFHIALSRKEAELIANEIVRDYVPRIEIEHCTPKPLSECVAYYTGLPVRDGEAIEDYLNRYYIPRPCDDNGEPWKVDDPCIAKGEEGTVAGFDDEEFINVCSNSSHVHFWCDKRYVKRPTPKVYDADGVPYARGETIYGIESGDAFEVLNPNLRDGYMEARELQGKRENCEIKPRSYTHERPVFDAEGVRCKRGETVWDKCGEQHEITLLHPDKEFSVQIENGDCYKASDITHREPDSFEKLRDDMVITHDASDEPCSTTEEWIDRLTALIERGA